MKKRYLLILLILAGMLLTYYYEPSLDALRPDNQVAETEKTINFYLENLETRTFNAQGVHTNTLSSIYALQYVGKNEILLDHPEMQIALNLSPWTAYANTGTSSENQKKITLRDKVLLSRNDGIADVNTEILVFDSQDEVAYTESPVEILAYGSKTNADGVFIDLNKEIIHLKDNVRTYYVPEAARSGRHKPKR